MTEHFNIDTSSAEFKQCCKEYNEILKKKGKKPLSFDTYVKLLKSTYTSFSDKDKRLKRNIKEFIRYRLDKKFHEKRSLSKKKSHIQININSKDDDWQVKWDSKPVDEKKRLANNLLASLFSDMAEDIDDLYEAYKDKYIEQDKEPVLSKTKLLENIESQIKKWKSK